MSKPRFALRVVPLLLAVLLAQLVLCAGCRSEEDKLVAGLVTRLEEAIAVLEQHRGDQKAAVAGLQAIHKSHEREIEDYRKRIEKAIASLPEEERKAHEKRLNELRASIENLARTYPEPIGILRAVSVLY